MIVHPFLSTLLKTPQITVEVLDIREDTTANSIYNFQDVNFGANANSLILGDLSGGVVPGTRDNNASIFYVIVHGEDATQTFNVSSVVMDGGVVNLTEVADRGGGTTFGNTAFYRLYPNDLNGVSNTDIDVTWSEAITGCAIVVIKVSGLTIGENVVSSSSNGISASIAPPSTASQMAFFPNKAMAIVAGVNLNSGVTSAITDLTYSSPTTSVVNAVHNRTLLYEISNANFTYCAWLISIKQTYLSSLGATLFASSISWSAGSFEHQNIIVT